MWQVNYPLLNIIFGSFEILVMNKYNCLCIFGCSLGFKVNIGYKTLLLIIFFYFSM